MLEAGPMETDNSVTHWIDDFRHGDQFAAQALWERYFQRLVHLARQRLPARVRQIADEEDVALSAFKSFCRGVEAGRFPRLADRDDLWRLLVVITGHKSIHLVRDQRRQKRGGDVLDDNNGQGMVALSQIIGQEPTPEFAAQVAEEFRLLLDRLGNEELCSVAIWKMEGYTNDEIADRLKCATRTVERKLFLIRRVLEDGEVTV
jgi:DNA-directed RNA polymerase specialized sigma24 family protein